MNDTIERPQRDNYIERASDQGGFFNDHYAIVRDKYPIEG